MEGSDPGSGQVIGGFEILSVLGRGGMGVVYRAHDPNSGRDVALKLVSGEVEPARLARFRREGEITASLNHPGIVGIHAAGLEGEQPYLAYELLEGCSDLEAAMADRDLRGRIELIRDAARALGYAHQRKVVHRDVKPENILVDGEGRVRIADFGLATAAGLERLTQSGGWVGTPSYMSPEQLKGKSEGISPRADVWSLGVILYQAITGNLPYVAATFFELTAQIHRAAPRPPRDSDRRVPPELESVCLRALSVDPDERFADADRFADELDNWLAGREVSTRPPGRWRRAVRRRAAWGAPLLALGGLGVVLLGPFGAPAPDLAKGADADRDAPRGELSSPRPGEHLGTERVLVRGSAVDDGDWIDVEVAGERQRVRSGGRFRFEVQLPVGEGELSVVLRDLAGNEVRLERRVTRHATPAWWRRRAPATRHSVPLPDGVAFGEGDGEYVNEKDGSLLVWVPPGRFRMGSDDPLGGKRNAQIPAHEVTLTRGFFLGKYETTWANYWEFCRSTGRSAPRHLDYGGAEAGPRQPVFSVRWQDARDYCAWAGLRLPTEAEWEYAARGGDEERPYPWGFEDPKPEHGNWGGSQDGHSSCAPVGSYPAGASRWGALDLCGNVNEWVATAYRDYPAGERVDPGGEPGDDDPEAMGVGRGGDYGTSVSEQLRSTYRFEKERSDITPHWGFRVCRDGR